MSVQEPDKPKPEVDLSPYVGRWVALVDEQVAGVGHTGAEAAHLARRNRPKVKFSLHYVEAAGGKPLALSSLLNELEPVLAKLDVPVYLVGGAVRDALLGRVSHDLDFAVPERAIKVAYRVGDLLGVPAYVLDKERDVGRVVLAARDMTLDFARFRGPDLEADLWDRDFTINAMALPAVARTDSSVIDPFGGRDDLAAGIVRQVHDRSLADDPIRGLRAIRMGLRYGFALTADTEAGVKAAAAQLHTTSAERVRDELLNLFQTAPHRALEALRELEVLPLVLPKIAALEGVEQAPPHHEPVLAHTISVLRWLAEVEANVVDRTAQNPWFAKRWSFDHAPRLAHYLARRVAGGLDGRLLLRLGALYHDVGKAQTQTIDPDDPVRAIRFFGHDKVGAGIAEKQLRALKLSREAVQHVKRIVAGHMRPLHYVHSERVSRRAIHRFFRRFDTAGLDIGLLSLADHLAMYAGMGPENVWEKLLAVVAQLFDYYFEQFEETVRPEPLVDGRDLMQALGLETGPEIGRLLRLIEEARAAGEIKTRAEALQFARSARE